MFARSALRTSLRAAARPSVPTQTTARRAYSSPSPSPSPSQAKPAEDHSGGPNKSSGSPTVMIAAGFGVCFVGLYAFMMGNPEKAQDVAGKISADAASKEHKFRRPTSTS